MDQLTSSLVDEIPMIYKTIAIPIVNIKTLLGRWETIICLPIWVCFHWKRKFCDSTLDWNWPSQLTRYSLIINNNTLWRPWMINLCFPSWGFPISKNVSVFHFELDMTLSLVRYPCTNDWIPNSLHKPIIEYYLALPPI